MANQSIFDAFERMWQHVNAAITSIDRLPAVTAEDNDKILRVSNGVWVASKIPSAEEEDF